MQPITFRRFEVPSLGIFSYLIGDPVSKQCVIIDPVRIIDPYVEAIKSQGMQLKAILETHVHADFISGSKELKHYYKGAPTIYCSSLGGKEWTPPYADVLVVEGTEITVGPYRLKAMHTPGHTPEHVIWLGFDDARSKNEPWCAFTGDLLFVGGIGRPDLLGEKAEKILSKELYQSLFKRLSDLPDYVEVYPSHGTGSACGKIQSARPTSTLGYERQFTPELRQLPEDQWIVKLYKDMPAAPQAFRSIKKINAEGPNLMPENTVNLKKLAFADLESLPKNTWLIDIRDAEAFAAGHVKGAVNIMIGLNFCSWIQMVVPEKVPLVLIVPDVNAANKAAQDLRLVGHDEILGYILATEPQFQQTSMRMIAPEELQAQKGYTIVDVRTPAEWMSGHIPGAFHLELAKASQALSEIPRGSPIAVVCARGNRASIVASLLQKEGVASVANIRGGMTAWQKAGLPIVADQQFPEKN